VSYRLKPSDVDKALGTMIELATKFKLDYSGYYIRRENGTSWLFDGRTGRDIGGARGTREVYEFICGMATAFREVDRWGVVSK
jgi:hypothetical protein